MTSRPVTLLFTDLVNSTELLQRVGDGRAQRILYAHRQVLREVLGRHGGQEVKWLGDGLLTTFASVADGVRCAVTMAQRARRPVAGERLGLRLGLHVGEVLPDERDYVGTPVVLARRLCDQAAAGQILCSGVVVELLRGRRGFAFSDLGQLELKGFPEPLAAYEVVYEATSGAALLRHTPFTGRRAELRRLMARLEETRTGQGGVVLLAGEPGIGKTRLLEEVADAARARGGLVLWGRCYEGEAGRPFGPFVEALGEYVRTAAPEVLRADLGFHAAPLTRLVPALRERLPDTPEPVPLEPNEERVRLLDAVVQSLLALANRVPTVLALDDLHWADAGTVALLRHVARFAPRERLLVLGAYRDVEVAQHHPLTEALGTLPRETSYEQLSLGGLNAAAVKDLVDAVIERDAPAAWVEALTEETSGNPFFLVEVLLNLKEEGALAGDSPKLEGLHLPDTVRQVIVRRLERLSDATNQLLRVAAAFTNGIDFEVARQVAGLEERTALDALDAALGAQLLVPVGAGALSYDFTHDLMRQTLYESLSPARRARLHRQVADAVERVHGDPIGEHAAQAAYQYARSASLPGAERGVPHALVAAERAETAFAHETAAALLRIALTLLPEGDARRPRLLGRLGLTLARARVFEEGSALAGEAAESIARTEGHDEAAAYLAIAVTMFGQMGSVREAWKLAAQGLRHAPPRHNLTWAILAGFDLVRQEAEDPGNPGMILDSPLRREVYRVFAKHGVVRGLLAFPFDSRRDLLERAIDDPNAVMNFGGELRRGCGLWEEYIATAVQQGQTVNAVMGNAMLARGRIALGDFATAEAACARAAALAERVMGPSLQIMQLAGARYEQRLALDIGWEEMLAETGRFEMDAPELYWVRGGIRASAALLNARIGQRDLALAFLASVIPALGTAPPWSANYPQVACDAAEVLWILELLDHVDVIERSIRDKVLAPDFRYMMRDARLAMARLCALQQRENEAAEWFAKARAVLEEQGARPLRAIVDYDEALMYARRAAPGDAARARPLLGAALRQFHALGMPGWIRRAESLQASVASAETAPAAYAGTAPSQSAPPPDGRHSPDVTLRREGDYWTLVYAGVTSRLKDMKGLHYLIHLLEYPGQEFHVLDLLGQATGAISSEHALHRTLQATDLPLLDATAKASYRCRLVELREDLAEAECHHDIGRAERARAEIDALTQQLAAAVGLRGRNRPSGSAAERARTTVTHRLRTAVRRIAGQHPGLGDHLSARVRTGTFCTYSPDPEHPIRWTLGG